MSDIISGPLWAARNWSADAGAGSIHDDDTAQELGFRGGTVAGDVHMNQFAPVLVQVFGEAWFEQHPQPQCDEALRPRTNPEDSKEKG